MAINYIRFAVANRRLITFGFLIAFASSFGQTFFIGVFGPGIQTEFNLSHTSWGTIYMIGTLASAALLPWTGKQIDRLDLRRYTVIVCLLLIGACAFLPFITNAAALIFAIFLLRQSGQGLMSHVSITSMARYFDKGRGRAIALASLGFATGEAFLPFMAVLAIAEVGWRWSYGCVAALLSISLIPAAMWMLKGHDQRHRMYISGQSDPVAQKGKSGLSWTRSEVLHDIRFYLMMPGILAPSLILTAMFFHHLNLADAKGWTHVWITGNYIIYAMAGTLTKVLAGPAIDRIGATRIVSFMLVPLTLAMVVVAEFHSLWIAYPYFILIGINIGIAHTTVPAMWAEIYGVDNLGAINSLMSALGVFGSALGPVIVGVLMDKGMSIESVCLLFSAYTIFGAVLITAALTGRSKSKSAKGYL
jgi:MFS family permease